MFPSYHDTSIPAIAEFVKDMQAAGTATPANMASDGVSGWLAVYAVQAVLHGATGPFTASSLTSALNSAKNVDLKGLLTWTPSAPGPTPRFQRAAVSDVYFLTVKGGYELPNPAVKNQPLDGLAAVR